MTAPEIADAIAELCQTDSSVTHGTLVSRLGDAVRGDWQVSLEENFVIFVGVSEAFVEAFRIIRTETPARVVIRPIEFMCLMIDGGPIPAKMPQIRRPPKGGYKTPHFAAVCFDRAEGNAKYVTVQQREVSR
jgi:hypothetical protein